MSPIIWYVIGTLIYLGVIIVIMLLFRGSKAKIKNNRS